MVEEPTLDVTKDYLPMTYQEYIGELALGYQPTLWQEFKVGLDTPMVMLRYPRYRLCSGGYTRIGGFTSYRLILQITSACRPKVTSLIWNISFPTMTLITTPLWLIPSLTLERTRFMRFRLISWRHRVLKAYFSRKVRFWCMVESKNSVF